MTDSRIRGTASLLGGALFLCLVLAVPCLLSGWMVTDTLVGMAQKIRDAQDVRIPYLIEGNGKPPGEILAAPFFKMWQKARKQSSPEEALAAEATRLKARFPGWFEVVLFDSQARVIASRSDRPEIRGDLEEFARDLTDLSVKGFGGLLNRFISYRRFLGPCVQATPLHFSGSFTSRASGTRRRAFLGLFGMQAGSPSLLFWLSLPQDIGPREAALRIIVESFPQVDREYLEGVIDPTAPVASWPRTFGPAAPFLPTIVGRRDLPVDKPFYQDGFQWWLSPVDANKILVAALPDPAGPLLDAGRRKLYGGIALVIGGCLLAWASWFRRSAWTPSLRLKLFCLFGYTGGIPLLLFLISAHGLIQERQQVMERQIFREHETALREMDRQFLDFQGWIEEGVMRQTRRPIAADQVMSEKMRGFFRELILGIGADGVSIFNGKGREIVSVNVRSGRSKLERIAPIIGLQSARWISRVNDAGHSPDQSTREQAIQATAEGLGVDLDLASGLWERHRHAFISYRAGSAFPMRTLGLALWDHFQRILAVGFFYWDGGRLLEAFLDARRESIQAKWPDVRLGYDDDGIRSRPYPEILKKSWERLNLLQQRDPSIPNHLIWEDQGKRYFLTSWKGAEVEANLLAVSTDDRIRTEVSMTVKRLAWVGLLILCLGSGIIWTISRNFLEPIALLGQGLENMRRRDFLARIPVRSEDEFGRVTSAFNRMMEGMGDLEVARVVQETFFPQTSMQGGGWEVSGISLSARKIGGDYFDYFALPNGRWLILMGDVTGHGVAACLGVAMAKALAFHHSALGLPSAILREVNQGFAMTMRQRRHMTFFLAVFEPATGLLLSSNAGHPYPFVVRGGTVSPIENPHPLLGRQTRIPFRDVSTTLAGTDVLCLFSDGLVEALDPKGIPLGFDRLAAALPGLIAGSAPATLAAMRAWVDRETVPDQSRDDLTLIILQAPVLHP